MKSIIKIFLIFILCNNIYAKNIKICTDNNFWYPFTFVKDSQAVGLHIDIINQALINLKYTPEFVSLPWLRCLKQAEEGFFDAIATASYKDQRAIFLHYPEGAKDAKKSPWRVTQAEYVVINYIDSDYTYNGDIKTIPTPVRIARGYSIIDTFEKEGIKIQTSAGTTSNFKKLVRDKNGSIIDLPEVAKALEKQFPNQYKVQSEPISSKSYYFPFTKKGNISLDEAKIIWEEIKKTRDNTELVEKFYLKY